MTVQKGSTEAESANDEILKSVSAKGLIATGKNVGSGKTFDNDALSDKIFVITQRRLGFQD